MAETWGPYAIVRPGPAAKTGYPHAILRRGAGVVVHSAEGSLDAALGVLDGPAPSSWHMTVCKDGRYFQHYPIETITWHAGVDANVRYVGVECEGKAGEPLTIPQALVLGGIIDWLELVDAWPARERHVTLFEHNEFMPTSCPSGRIPWDDLLTPPAPPVPAPLELLVTLAGVVLNIGQGAPPAFGMDAEDARNIRWLVAQL